MAFPTPQSEYDEVRQTVDAQFIPEDRDEAYSILLPLMEEGKRVPLSILYLAKGNLSCVRHLAECARLDFRDVIYWAENPSDAALDAPKENEELAAMFEWLGVPRFDEPK